MADKTADSQRYLKSGRLKATLHHVFRQANDYFQDLRLSHWLAGGLNADGDLEVSHTSHTPCSAVPTAHCSLLNLPVSCCCAGVYASFSQTSSSVV